MKILFVLPSVSELKENKNDITFTSKFLWGVVFGPLLTFQMLAAVTPPVHSMKLIDERYQKIDFDEEFDIIGISATTSGAVRAYEIADKYRKKGIPVVLGGWHPTALPNEAKQHADAVVIGDG